jgi:hypothetical protein
MRKLSFLASLLLVVAAAQAAQQPVATGTSGNDHSGDPLRTAFTKLNANDAELYGKFPVSVANGGTGATTLTGVLKGNGTSAFTAATAANLISLWTGSCSITVPLRGDGSCGTLPAASITGLATVATSGNATDLSAGTLAAARGGAGTITGALKGNGSGVVSQAACADLSNAAASCSIDATNATNIGSGTLPAAQLPALTGDVTTTVGTAATTVKQVHNNVTSINNAVSPYAVTATDSFIYCDATAGAVVINLPAATGTGRDISFKKIDSTANACTPTRAGSDTIDGATSYSLTAQYAASKITDAASAVWYRTHTNQLGGDVIGTSTANTVAKVNGNTPGGTCTNQAVTSLNSSAVPTCTTLTSAYVDTSIAQTGASNSFTGTTQQISSTEPRLKLNQTGAGTDQKLWDIDVASGVLTIRTRTDADGAGVNVLTVTRGTGTADSNITLGDATGNPTFTLAGTSNLSIGGILNTTGVSSSGSIGAARFNVTAATVATNGIYLSGTNTVGISTNTTARGTVDANGALNWNKAIVAAGTKPTVTGCSNTTTLGGAVGGSYLSGTSGTCTVTITLPTGPTNGYACFAHDDTTAADYTQSAIVTATTTLTISGATVTGDKIVWGCPLGY